MAVYFIQAGEGGPVKVGHGRDPRARLTACQIGSPERLVLIGTRDGGRDEERAIHERFAEHRINGEWFKPVPELLALIEHRPTEKPANPVDEIVRRLGGNAAVARRYGVTPPAVSNWKKTQRFPARLVRKLERDAELYGFRLDPALFPIEELRP